jgi:hypothetical protein
VELGDFGVDGRRTLSTMAALVRSSRYHGALGLIVWANAVTEGTPVEGLLEEAGSRLENLPEVAEPLRTMEVAWLLSGLAHEVARSPRPATKAAFDSILESLLSRYMAGTRLFCHATEAAPLRQRVRRWVANFADQIYSIQALSQAAIVTGAPRPIETAARAAERIVALQGNLGQWWWHYDVRRGRVCNAYPVYSVHQYGMGPMGLRTLALARGPALDAAIDSGRAWLTNNETGKCMIDYVAGTIWRAVDRDEDLGLRLLRQAMAVAGSSGEGQSATRLKLNHETRPYEWAWYLFAIALNGGHRQAHHLA